MLLDQGQKKSLLAMIKSFLKQRNVPEERTTIEQYNKDLEEAEAEFERGEYITHEELLKQMKQW